MNEGRGRAARGSDRRESVTRLARCVALAIVAALMAVAAGASAATSHHHHHHDNHHGRATPTPTPKPKPAPKVVTRPLVLVTGGTGTISVPTGDSPAVLDSAEIYDPVSGSFQSIAPMTAHRDRHAAVLMRDGRVLVAGGVDTELVPMIVFPGPAMPSILSSAEVFDPANGTFNAVDPMTTP